MDSCWIYGYEMGGCRMKMIIHYVSGETQKWDFTNTKGQEIREALFKTDFH